MAPAVIDRMFATRSPHGVSAVGDGVEYLAVRHAAQAVLVEAGDGHKAVLAGDAVAAAAAAVATRRRKIV
jgi:hypothetical protein